MTDFPQINEKGLQQVKDDVAKESVVPRTAKKLIKKYHFKTIATDRGGEFYYYYDGIYIYDKGKRLLQETIEAELNELATEHKVKEVIGKIKRLTFLNISKDDLVKGHQDLICVNNGILNLKTLELKKHTSKKIFLTKLPVDYEPNAQCPEIDQFFKSTLYEEDIQIIIEWFGYCLYRDYFVKKAVILTGAPGGGKTQMLNLLVAFIGTGNASGASLQDLASKPFARAELYGRMVNVCDDLDNADIKNNGVFKMVTGNSRLKAEVKFLSPFYFINFAKLIFSANKIPLPKTEIDDDAFYSRWIVLQFDTIFNDDNTDKDPFILQKITTKKELSGLLNLALIGLDKLLKKHKFSYDKSPDETMAIMQRSGSSISSFAQDKLQHLVGHIITVNEMYNAYTTFCSKHHLPVETIATVGRRLTNYAKYVVKTHNKPPKGKEQKIWRNVAFKSLPIDKQDDLVDTTDIVTLFN